MLKRSLKNKLVVFLRYTLPQIITDAYYWLGANNRKTPDFIIIGAQKAGTTSLFELLSNHPDITMSRRKEIHFFAKYYHKGMRYYRSFFPKKTSGKVTGEASPYYLFHPLVPERIKRTLPKTKIIILLRNPVERAYSHYQMMKGLDPSSSFEEAISLENVRVIEEEKKITSDPNYKSDSHQAFSYMERGMYHKQLKRWLKYYELDELLIVSSKKFYSNPKEVLTQVYGFLNVDPIVPNNLSARNVRNYARLSPDEFNVYRDYFEEDNERLKELINIDLLNE